MNNLTIPKSEYLTKEQKDILENIKEYYPVIPNGMTPYQIEMFVLQVSEFPTWYAVYHQCVLESWTRFTSIIEILDNIETIKLQNELRQVTISELCRGDSKERIRAKILKHKIQINERQIMIIFHELEVKFKELGVYEKVKNIAKEKLGDFPPEYGDEKQESLKWYLKFMFNKHPLRSSLIAGEMKNSNEDVAKYLNDLSKEEKAILNINQLQEQVKNQPQIRRIK